MPYIRKDIRNNLEGAIDELSVYITSPGELNYVITRLSHELTHNIGENYDGYNAVIGVLECAKLEMYRRRVAPYEDLKIKENGDIG
jgi:hypothetical protein